jgi:hypothetical protein
VYEHCGLSLRHSVCRAAVCLTKKGVLGMKAKTWWRVQEYRHGIKVSWTCPEYDDFKEARIAAWDLIETRRKQRVTGVTVRIERAKGE